MASSSRSPVLIVGPCVTHRIADQTPADQSGATVWCRPAHGLATAIAATVSLIGMRLSLQAALNGPRRTRVRSRPARACGPETRRYGCLRDAVSAFRRGEVHS